MVKRQSKKIFVSKNEMAMKKLVIVIVALVAIVLVILHSSYVNYTEIENQVKKNLEDVAKQNAAILNSKIDAQYELILSLSKELNGVTEDTIEGKLGHFNIFIENFDFKRFAFCFPDGTTYSTDGEVTDLSYRNFYKNGMEGKCYITEILSDAIQDDDTLVNIMTIPVTDDDGNVTGVFGVAYDTMAFNQALQIDSFEGKGYSCIINSDGKIMATTTDELEKLELSHDIIEDVLKTDKRNEDEVENLQMWIDKGEEGRGVLYLNEKSYYYSVPVQLMDNSVTWYILTVVPSELLNDRVLPIQKNQYITSAIVIFFVFIASLLVIVFIRNSHKKIIDFMYNDVITQGANFMKFYTEFENSGQRKGYMVAMDIANFNNISLVSGEKSAHKMIKETWEIISEEIGKEELACHVRDDLFLMLFAQQEEESLIGIIDRISRKLHEKAKAFHVYGIQARYGIYAITGEESMENAYSKVKIAREYAEINPKVNYVFYDEINRVKMQYERQLEANFPAALENEEFEVWYQPKYSASDCSIVGSEALVRWKSANGEMISPGQFIPLFESNGMIVKLDEYMFRMVCRQQRKWIDEGKTVYPVSINISRASLYCLGVEKRYSEIMQQYNIEPQYVQIEVTETVMEEKTDISKILNEFRSMGIKILMDDFGTGYSSLATLSSQCFDTLKLDKTLVDHIGDKDGETMLYHIIRMGQQMGLHITAEGVEKQTQLEFLQNLKCDDIQGFYFAKPMPTDEYERMINSN